MRLCFLWLAGVSLAFGQLAPQVPEAAYRGENVSAVSLIANPHRDISSLVPLVTQKVGQPYSPEQIQASVQALTRAGDFKEVHVNVVPEIAGLKVEFLLEPAYYVGIVNFPGAEKHFTYTRLLQVANYSDQDPYDATQLPLAEAALEKFFRQNGYFQSKIHAERSIDDAHQLVNVSFVVDLGQRARISSVHVEGSSEAETARLLHAVRSLRARLTGGLLKPGKPYSLERIKAASSQMKRTLVKQHRLTSKIKENPPEYDGQSNRVSVSFQVELGPVVTIRTVGAKLTSIPFLEGREVRKLIPVYSEGAVDRDLIDEGQRNLVDFFQKKGFYDAKVSSEFRTDADQILIVYTIDRGQKRKVERIDFRGNHVLTSTALMTVVAVKKSHIWTHGSLSQKLLKQSADNIEALYRDKGYEDVKVSSRVIDRERKADIAFDIEEGPQTLVSAVKVTGNEHIPASELAPKGLMLKSGAAYSPRKLADDRNRISATYLDHGYLNAEVKATVTPLNGDRRRLAVTYAITEHQLVRVSEVFYSGQRHTKLSLMEKAAQIPSEQPMQREKLLVSESRLYDLGIFDWASVGPRKPVTDQTDEMALVKVHEAKRNEITYGLGFEVSHRGGNVPTGTVALPGGGGTIGLNGYQIAPSQETFASPRGLIEITRRNMRGLAETASASLLLSRLDQKVLATYAQPHFFGSQWQSLGAFSIERTSENPLFTAALGDLSFQLERVLHRKTNTRLQFRYDFNKTDLSHILVPQLVLPQDVNVRLSTVSGTFLRDTRDKPLDAHRGTFTTLNLGITPTAFGSSANFAKLFGQYAFYKPVHSIVFADSIRVGLAKPFSSSFIPTSQLFFSGGGTSLRSFPIDEAGPQRLVPFCNVLQGQSGCVDVTVPVGGRQLVIFNSEVRFPLHINKALGGVVFYDGGNVYSAINLPSFINDYTNTVGFGLRYATPIGPVRIDVGRNLNPVPGINPTQYYITIGQAF